MSQQQPSEFTSLNDHLQEIIEYLNQHKNSVYIMDLASRDGKLEVVKYIYTFIGATCTRLAMDWACVYGHLEIVKYLHEVVGLKISEDTMYFAIKNGHLKIVKYLYYNCKTKGGYEYAMNLASRHGHLDIVKFFTEDLGLDPTDFTLSLAVETGHLEIVKYMQEEEYHYCTHFDLYVASENGHLKIVKYLQENGLTYEDNINLVSKEKQNVVIINNLENKNNSSTDEEYIILSNNLEDKKPLSITNTSGCYQIIVEDISTGGTNAIFAMSKSSAESIRGHVNRVTCSPGDEDQTINFSWPKDSCPILYHVTLGKTDRKNTYRVRLV